MFMKNIREKNRLMRINKRYKSFEELDRDLMLLKLQADVCREEIRMVSQRTKNAFRPAEMTRTFVSSYVRRTLTSRAIDIALNLVRTWRYRKY